MPPAPGGIPSGSGGASRSLLVQALLMTGLHPLGEFAALFLCGDVDGRAPWRPENSPNATRPPGSRSPAARASCGRAGTKPSAPNTPPAKAPPPSQGNTASPNATSGGFSGKRVPRGRGRCLCEGGAIRSEIRYGYSFRADAICYNAKSRKDSTSREGAA